METNLSKIKTLFEVPVKISYIYFEFEIKNPILTNMSNKNI